MFIGFCFYANIAYEAGFSQPSAVLLVIYVHLICFCRVQATYCSELRYTSMQFTHNLTALALQ